MLKLLANVVAAPAQQAVNTVNPEETTDKVWIGKPAEKKENK